MSAFIVSGSLNRLQISKGNENMHPHFNPWHPDPVGGSSARGRRLGLDGSEGPYEPKPFCGIHFMLSCLTYLWQRSQKIKRDLSGPGLTWNTEVQFCWRLWVTASARTPISSCWMHYLQAACCAQLSLTASPLRFVLNTFEISQ